MSRKWLILVACVGIVLLWIGLAYRTRHTQWIDGIGGIQPLTTVLKAVRQTSPLQVVTSTDVTKFLPIRHVIFGRDAQGRALVVWARTDAERFVYLDQLKIRTSEDALTAATAAGMDVHAVRFAVLSYWDRNTRPVVWHIGTDTREFYIDATTGSISE